MLAVTACGGEDHDLSGREFDDVAYACATADDGGAIPGSGSWGQSPDDWSATGSDGDITASSWFDPADGPRVDVRCEMGYADGEWTVAQIYVDGAAVRGDGEYSSPEAIVEALSGTRYECDRWSDYGEDSGNCRIILSETGTSRDISRNSIRMTDNPELYAAVLMDDYKSVGSVVGEDWLFDCGEDMDDSDCSNVALVLGGEQVYRGYWD